MAYAQAHTDELHASARHFGRHRLLTTAAPAAGPAFAVQPPVPPGPPSPSSRRPFSRPSRRPSQPSSPRPPAPGTVSATEPPPPRHRGPVRPGGGIRRPPPRLPPPPDPARARADFRTVSAVTAPGAPVGTAGSFVTEAGDPGLTPA
ncbi:hypothetical protein ACFUJR_01420 [Streptomyces sp. NPDC057271]|uniref:hypothetical protein n=1 Tax=unclassified Streptomyces TaxID=2593676 RepID=UPI003636F0AA